MTETPNVPDGFDRRICAGWMSFKRYIRELHDRPKASLLPLKACGYGEMRGSRGSPIRMRDMDPLKGHYNRPRTRLTHYRMLVRFLGAWFK